MQDHLHGMWEEEVSADGGESMDHEDVPLPPDPDAGNPRASMASYVALIGEDVALNLEGLARARVEKHPRAYQTDAQVHQAYMKATSGGGEGGEGADEGDGGEEASGGLQPGAQVFPPIPWGFFSQEELLGILRFEHRKRLTPFAKELVALPSMRESIPELSAEEQQWRSSCASYWRERYTGLSDATVEEKLALKKLQDRERKRSKTKQELMVYKSLGRFARRPPKDVFIYFYVSYRKKR